MNAIRLNEEAYLAGRCAICGQDRDLARYVCSVCLYVGQEVHTDEEGTFYVHPQERVAVLLDLFDACDRLDQEVR